MNALRIAGSILGTSAGVLYRAWVEFRNGVAEGLAAGRGDQ